MGVKGAPVERQRGPSWASKGPALFNSVVARPSCYVVVLLHEQRERRQAERIFGHAY